MNIISAVFTDPGDVESQRAVDFLESEVSPELVSKIRRANSRQTAAEAVAELYKLMLDDEKHDYDAEIESWLFRVARMTGSEDRAGLHIPSNEANV